MVVFCYPSSTTYTNFRYIAVALRKWPARKWRGITDTTTQVLQNLQTSLVYWMKLHFECTDHADSWLIPVLFSSTRREKPEHSIRYSRKSMYVEWNGFVFQCMDFRYGGDLTELMLNSPTKLISVWYVPGKAGTHLRHSYHNVQFPMVYEDKINGYP